MSYYYRKRYNNSYSRTSSAPTQVEKQPKKSFDITEYIKNEFFHADDIIFARIAKLYKELYGYGPYKYMIDTFYSWKSGYTGLSGQTMQRILECVPKFLTDDKRFFILKSEIIYFIETLHFKQQNKIISLSQLNSLFEDYENEIANFNQVNLSWFVGKKIFTETEIEQFLSVCKYALKQKLNLSYRQMKNDILLTQSKLKSLKTGIFISKYQIDFLNSCIDLSRINTTAFEFIKLPEYEIKLEGTFKQFAEEYIMDELLKMDFAEREGQVNHFIKSKDLDYFITQYNQLSKNDHEVSLNSEFKGEGGVLTLSLEAKSFKKIQKLIFISISKLIMFVVILIISIFTIFHFQLYKLVFLIFWGGLLGAGMLFGAISKEIKLLNKLNLDLKLYGK